MGGKGRGRGGLKKQWLFGHCDVFLFFCFFLSLSKLIFFCLSNSRYFCGIVSIGVPSVELIVVFI